MRSALFCLAALTASAQVQVFVTLPLPLASYQPGEPGVGNLSGASGISSSSAGTMSAIDISYDGGSYNATIGPATLGFAGAWSVQIDGRSLVEGSHTIRARATDSLGNIGYSPVVPFTVANSHPVCAHTQIGPVGIRYFLCQPEATTAAGGSGSPLEISMTLPAVAGMTAP